MNTRIIPALLGALLFSGVAEAAPSIYPVDTARFLGGSRFDFKVEFDGQLAEKDAKVLINGQDAKAVLGAKPEFIAKEKGADGSALLLRGASLKPGQYKVTVESPTGKASANWDVYGTPDNPVAKNVILLIADGLSMGHRTSARLMSKGVTNGMYNGKLSMDTLPYTAMLGTCSVDSIAADSANTASAYMTGHKSSVNALGVYADRTPDSLDDPETGNHRRTAPPHDRQIHRRGFGRRNRGRDPGFRGRAYPPPRRQGRNRGYVLQREARRHHRRWIPPTSCLRTSPAPSARTTRTTSKCSRRKAMPSPRPTPNSPRP